MNARFPRRVIRLLSDSGWFEGRTLLLLFVVFGCLFVFVEIADEVREGSTTDVDHMILDELRVDGNRAKPIGPAWLTASARDISALGGVSVLAFLSLLVLGFLLLHRQWRHAVVMLVAILGATGLNLLLKRFFDRDRPELAYHLIEVGNQSFPSGHSMLSAATYLTLGMMLASVAKPFWTKVYFLGAAVCTAVLVGLTRVYLGVHYPTDVAGGWTIGAAWALLCALVAHRIARRDVSASSTAPA